MSESEPIFTAEEMATKVIPTPYVDRATLQLEVIQNYQDLPVSQVAGAHIISVLGVTMSSVMRVAVLLDSGQKFEAVLKLYDRRFGIDLRGDGYLSQHWPLTIEKEELFESFVRSKEIEPFLARLAQDEKKKGFYIPSSWFYSNEDDEEKDDIDWGRNDAERFARYETNFWRDCEYMFKREVKAYEHLKEFQGTEVPRLLATVRLIGASSIVPGDLINEPAAKYWDVKGILLQYIPGVKLINLASSSIDSKEWESLVQRSVDLAHKINKSGLVNRDCQPRNVIIERQSQQPFFIDFEYHWLKEEMDEAEDSRPRPDDEAEGEDDLGEFIPDDEYWHRAWSCDNPGEIGAVMTNNPKRKKNVEIKIQYPDIKKLMVRPQDYIPLDVR